MKTQELLEASGGQLLCGKPSDKHKNIVIDSRKVKRGDVFIAINGEKFDGHDFIGQALKLGATAIIIHSDIATKKHRDISIIKVKNTLKALQSIAHYHRMKFNIPIIGITGSSGKTTTKDIVASILSQELRTLKSEENLNNEYGVPLTLLRLNKSHQAAVIEMAMQKSGEMEILAGIVRPTIAVITNIGEAHLKYLKTKRNVAKAKSEILAYLTSKDQAVLPADDKYFRFLKKQVPSNAHAISFGIEKIIKFEKFLKHITLPGRHNIYNTLIGIKIAKLLGLKDRSIIEGIKKFKPSSKRMEFIKLKNGAIIINDTYNANPQSMRAALLTLASLNGGRKIAVLGDMLELGRISNKAHKELGQFCRKLGVDKLVTVGKLSKNMHGDIHCANALTAAEKIKTIIKPRDIILVKGSRGIKMDAAVVELAYTYV